MTPSLQEAFPHVTGITHIVAELTGKRPELLKEIVPSPSLAVMVNPEDPNARAQILEHRETSAALAYRLRPSNTSSASS